LTAPENKIWTNLLARVRQLSLATEFAIVIIGAFGWLFVANLIYKLFPGTQAQVTEQRLQLLLIYEPIVLVCVFVFLRLRGWTLDRINPWPSVKETTRGVVLVVVSYAVSAMAVTLFAAISPTVEQSAWHFDALFGAPIGWGTIIALSIVNPIFEETLANGYVISTLKERAPYWMVVGTSVVIQLGYHLYQGPAGLIAIAPSAFIFANLYYRDGRLWPLIVAHAVLDFIGLSAAGYR
jgi:uncharacterized protein